MKNYWVGLLVFYPRRKGYKFKLGEWSMVRINADRPCPFQLPKLRAAKPRPGGS